MSQPYTKYFVDRTELIKLFDRLYEAISSGDAERLIVEVTGMGGIGKSELLNLFASNYSRKAILAHIDAKAVFYDVSNFWEFLYLILKKVYDHLGIDIKNSRFMVLLSIYLRVRGRAGQIPELRTLATELRDPIIGIASSIPVVGTLINVLYNFYRLFDTIRRHKGKREEALKNIKKAIIDLADSISEIKQLFVDEVGDNFADAIAEQIIFRAEPEILQYLLFKAVKWDLRDVTARAKSNKKPIIILIDTYEAIKKIAEMQLGERAFDVVVKGKRLSFTVEDLILDILRNLTYAIVVIAGRQVPTANDWKGLTMVKLGEVYEDFVEKKSKPNFDIVFAPLSMIPFEEVKNYLELHGITDERLQKLIFDISGGYPLIFSLIVKLKDELRLEELKGMIEAREDISVENKIRNILYSVIKHMLRHLPSSIQRAFYYAIIPKYFDRRLLINVASLLDPEFDEFLEKFGVIIRDYGKYTYKNVTIQLYSIHDEIRRIAKRVMGQAYKVYLYRIMMAISNRTNESSYWLLELIRLQFELEDNIDQGLSLAYREFEKMIILNDYDTAKSIISILEEVENPQSPKIMFFRNFMTINLYLDWRSLGNAEKIIDNLKEKLESINIQDDLKNFFESLLTRMEAELKLYQNKFSEASSLFKEAIEKLDYFVRMPTSPHLKEVAQREFFKAQIMLVDTLINQGEFIEAQKRIHNVVSRIKSLGEIIGTLDDLSIYYLGKFTLLGGKILIRLGNFKTAIESLQEAISYLMQSYDLSGGVIIDGLIDAAFAYRQLADAYYRLDNFDKAIEEIDNGLKLINKLFRDREVTDLIALKTKSVVERFYGYLLYRAGRISDAEKYLKKSLETIQQLVARLSIRDSDIAIIAIRAHRSMAMLYNSFGRFNEALEHIAKTRNIIDQVELEFYAYGDKRIKIEKYRLARAEADVYRAIGHYVKAIDILNNAIQDFERVSKSLELKDVYLWIEGARMYVDRAEVYMREGQYVSANSDVKTAIGYYENLLTGQVRYPLASIELGEAYRILADIQSRQGKYNEAINSVNKAIEILDKIERELEAEYVQSFLDLVIQKAQAYRIKGKVLIRYGESNKAIENLKMAMNTLQSLRGGDKIHMNIDVLIAWGYLLRTLGTAEATLGHFSDAEEYFEKAISNLKKVLELTEGRSIKATLQYAKTLYEYGEMLDSKGKFVDAIKKLTQATDAIEDMFEKIDNRPIDALNFLGRAYINYAKVIVHYGDFEKAKSALKKAIDRLNEAIERAPGFVDSLNDLGLAYRLLARVVFEKDRDVEKAKKYAEEAISKFDLALSRSNNAHIYANINKARALRLLAEIIYRDLLRKYLHEEIDPDELSLRLKYLINEYLMSAIKILERTKGTSTRTYWSIFHALGRCYQLKGSIHRVLEQIAESKRSYLDSIAAFKEYIGNSDHKPIWTLTAKARAHRDLSRILAEKENNLVHACDHARIAKSDLDEVIKLSHFFLALVYKLEILAILSKLYIKLNQKEEIDKLVDEFKSTYSKLEANYPLTAIPEGFSKPQAIINTLVITLGNIAITLKEAKDSPKIREILSTSKQIIATLGDDAHKILRDEFGKKYEEIISTLS